MKSILNLKSQESLYSDSSFLGKIKDRFKITYHGEKFIRDIDLSVVNVKIPSNVYPQSYKNNIKIAKKMVRPSSMGLSLDVWRMLDYYKFSNYQKRLFAFSVVQSIKLFLRLNFKNIRNSCIGVVDAGDLINKYIIEELCKVSNHVILLSNKIELLRKKREYLISNYGVTPIVTREYDYMLNNADFIISSRDIDPNNNKCNVWYINDRYIPNNKHNFDVNDVIFKVPWEVEDLKYNVQMVGAILSYMGGKDVERDLKSNDIHIDKFGFNL